MSSIPNSAMPHAKVHHDDDHKPKPDAKKTAATSDWVDDATDAAKAGLATATDAVKSHPKTAIAVGATVIAGIAAAIAAPALMAKEADKKAPTPADPKPGKGKKGKAA
ncbi:hypothetical protein [Sphingomonas faeni]|uniref:hypothetical protein n=1 Tax=Sphingomonas faeni TaxID=185950 RepID=UPI002787F8BD|nr:hypothetical protein [Sphingomonas faeni]MDQ0837498.1 hypothetical protein [Sphingomonas faeni]